MITDLIKFFKVVAVRPDENLLDPVQVNAYAIRCGYFVMPAACTAGCITFLKTQEANLNSTFYKDWQDVERRSELELRILQFMHYLSTYGTDYHGTAFTLNDSPAQIDYTKLTILTPCTERELFDRISDMLASGIAISDATLDILIKQLEEFKNSYDWKIDIDKVANREAEVRLCRMYGVMPSKPERLIRYLVYAATGMSVIIKNDDTWIRLDDKAESVIDDIIALDERQLKALASIFYRYKLVFLVLRSGIVRRLLRLKDEQPWEKIVHHENIDTLIERYSTFIKTINKIRRLARKYHKPMKAGVLETLLAGHTADEIRTALAEETSAFKLIKILNYIEYNRSDIDMRVYCIRNQKLFFKPAKVKSCNTIRLAALSDIHDMVTARIVEILKTKVTGSDGEPLTVRLPEHIDLAAPVSERQMIGAVPYGSTYTLMQNNYIGIYWRNEWGTHDFDLWMTDTAGRTIGWAAQHKSADILFSGDMTDADPEATEIFYGRSSWPDSTVQVLRYNGKQGSLLRLFFGSDKLQSLPKGYMVNPDSIHFIEDLVSDNREMTVALIHDGKVYFTALSSGNSKLPSADKSVTAIGALAARLKCSTMLRPLLLRAGFTEYDPQSDKAPDIDLSRLDKDTLINLFS